MISFSIHLKESLALFSEPRSFRKHANSLPVGFPKSVLLWNVDTTAEWSAHLKHFYLHFFPHLGNSLAWFWGQFFLIACAQLHMLSFEKNTLRQKIWPLKAWLSCIHFITIKATLYCCKVEKSMMQSFSFCLVQSVIEMENQMNG